MKNKGLLPGSAKRYEQKYIKEAVEIFTDDPVFFFLPHGDVYREVTWREAMNKVYFEPTDVERGPWDEVRWYERSIYNLYAVVMENGAVVFIFTTDELQAALTSSYIFEHELYYTEVYKYDERDVDFEDVDEGPWLFMGGREIIEL